MVKKKYEVFLKEGKIEKVELTPSRIKMATFPEGTEALRNPVGTAPGMLTHVGETSLIALPGVPPEMEAIFEESVASMIKKEAGKCVFFEKSIYVDGLMESNLAPLIDQAMHDNLGVYIKSHVYGVSRLRVEGQGPHIELHFSTTTEHRTVAKKQLNRAIGQLSLLVRKSGGRIRSRS
jgi:molybdopterin-biosynthesis enzyme MoeA-like protein